MNQDEHTLSAETKRPSIHNPFLYLALLALWIVGFGAADAAYASVAEQSLLEFKPLDQLQTGGEGLSVENGCMLEIFNQFGQNTETELNCTANDVNLSEASVEIIDGCDYPGDTATLDLSVFVDVTAAARHDIGIYLATDGGDAQSGMCKINTLPIDPDPPFVDLDGTSDNLPGTNDPSNMQDLCGDIDSAHDPITNSIGTITVQCTDPDADGLLDIGSCTSWRQPGQNDYCSSPLDAFPGSTSKCNCEILEVSVPVPGQIIIQKETDPDGNSTPFNFTLTGGPDGVNETFTLSDGQSWDSIDPNGDGDNADAVIVKPGTYSVSEAVPAGWDLTSATCDDGSDPDAIDLDPGETVTCSFNNLLVIEPPDISVIKTVSPTFVSELGGPVTYMFEVTNDGVSTVTLDSLIDSIYGDINGDGTCTLTQTLGPGESYSCSIDTTILENEAGTLITNIITATASNEAGTDEDSDHAIVEVVDTPSSILVIKDVTPGSLQEPGGLFTFTIEISNTSAIDSLDILTLTDSIYGNLDGQGDCSVPQNLPVGAGYSCSFSVDIMEGAGFTETDVITAAGIDDDGMPVDDDDDATITIVDVPSSIDVTKSASPASVPEPGGNVTFTVEVKNTSAVDDVTIETITDTVYGDISASCMPTLTVTLAPGETITCTFVEFVTGEAEETHENTVIAAGTDDDGNPVSGEDDETVTIVDVPSSIAVTKSADPTSISEPGGPVTFTVVVENTSAVDDVTIDDVDDSVFGNISGSCSPTLPATIAPTETITCTFVEDVTGNADDVHKNTATATGTDDDNKPVSGEDDAEVTITDLPSAIGVDKSASPNLIPEPGANVTFTVVIENESAVDIVTIETITDTVYDDISASCSTTLPVDLDPGDTITCIFVEFVSGEAGDVHTNIATAAGTDDDGNPVSDEDDAVVNIEDVPSSIDVTKEASPSAIDEPGANVTFTVTVENTSPVDDVTIETITDTVYGNISTSCSPALPATLEPTDTIVCTFIEFVAGNAGDVHENTVTAAGTDDDGNPVSDDDDAVVTIGDVPAMIMVSKDAVPNQVTEPGGPVLFTIMVQNTSTADSVTIDSVDDSIYDDVGDSCVPPLPALLGPGESLKCAFTETVSGNAEDTHTNVVTVEGTDDDNNPIDGTDDETVTITNVPSSIEVTKSADPTSVDEAGGDVTFTVVVENTSAVDNVEIITVTDTIYGDVSTSCAPTLPATIAPSGAITCTFTEFVDGAAGTTHTNVATADGTDDDGNAVSDHDDADVTITDLPSSMDVTKSASPTSVDEPGANVDFEIVVENTSAVDVITVTTIIDTVYGDVSGSCDLALPASLDPGDSVICAFTEFVSGTVGTAHVNVAEVTATDDDGNSLIGDDPAEVEINDIPSSIQVDKSASPTTVDENGGDVTFTVVVENTSAVDDVEIDTVVDSMFGNVSTSCSPALPATIEPGETIVCTFTEFISGPGGSTHTNVATADGQDDDGNPVRDEDDAIVEIIDSPACLKVLKIPKQVIKGKKTTDVCVPEVGGIVAFDIIVWNCSENDSITLDSIVDDVLSFTDDPLDLNLVCGLGGDPVVLGPDEEFVCIINNVTLRGEPDEPHVNTITVTGTDDNGEPVSDDDSAEVPFKDIKPDISLTKIANPTSISELGEDVTYTIEVVNQTLEAVTLDSLVDDKFGNLDGVGTCDVPQTIAGRGLYTCSFTQFISGNGGDHVNTVTAEASDDDGNSVDDSDDATVIIKDTSAEIVVIKDAMPTSVSEVGGIVTFTVGIKNLSTVDSVTIDTLTDSVYGNLNGQGTCSVPQTISTESSYICFFAKEVKGQPGEHVNVVTASGVDEDGAPVEDEDDAVVEIRNVPANIEVIKEATPSKLEGPGDVTYTITIKNLSVIDAVFIYRLQDDRFGDLDGQGTCDIAISPALKLEPGESYSCSFTQYIEEDHTNKVTAKGTDDDGTYVEADDTATVTVNEPVGQNPSEISVIKKAGPDDNATIAAAGGYVTFIIEVTNEGDLPVTITAIEDDIYGDVLTGSGIKSTNCTTATIAAGDTYSCSFKAFVDPKEPRDVVKVTAEDTNGVVVMDDDDAIVNVEKSGGVGTPGYWKNHTEVWIYRSDYLYIGDWDFSGSCDADEIAAGCFQIDVKDALKILNASQVQKGGDKRFTLGRALIAAWLNISVAYTNSSCIEDTLQEAILWMLDNAPDGNPLAGGTPVSGGSWNTGEPLYLTLDSYNNTGNECAVDRDQLGDMNCDKKVGSIDALFGLQGDVGLRTAVDGCPKGRGQFNRRSCNVNRDRDGKCDAIDALFILRCDVGYYNTFCPDPADGGARRVQKQSAINSNAIAEMGMLVTDSMGRLSLPVLVSPAGDSVNAATVQVSYDPAQLRPVGCNANPEDALDLVGCNEGYGSGLVRISGLSAGGLETQAQLAQLTFEVIGEATGDMGLAIEAMDLDAPQARPLAVAVVGVLDVTQDRWDTFLPLIVK